MGREAIYNCLFVCKLFYSSMDGPPLFDEIQITKASQIRQLLFCITKKVVRAQYIKDLGFVMRKKDWGDPSAVGKRELKEDLITMTYLLNLSTQIRSLGYAPLPSDQYQDVLASIRALPKLRNLGLYGKQPACTTGIIRQLDLEDSHRIIRGLRDGGNLFLIGINMSALPPCLCVLFTCVTSFGCSSCWQLS